MPAASIIDEHLAATPQDEVEVATHGALVNYLETDIGWGLLVKLQQSQECCQVRCQHALYAEKITEAILRSLHQMISP